MESILELLGKDTHLRRVASTNGGEYAGPCPFCGGSDRFRVWPNQDSGRWWCRQCGRNGDGIAYAVEVGRVSESEAYQLRHGKPAPMRAGPSMGVSGPRPSSQPEPCLPPSQVWQDRALAWSSAGADRLWGQSGQRALSWLRNRGLADETIRQAQLGYNSDDQYEDRELWGLDPGKPVYLPRGIIIPWFIGRHLWRVNVRRPVPPGGGPKYIGPAGSENGLYNADNLRVGKPAQLVEGELDALTVSQEAGDIVTPCATGSTAGSRTDRWIARLALSSVVLVSFDTDEAGEKAREWWLGNLANGRYWRPVIWKDANEMHQNGVNLRAWIAAGLGSDEAGDDQQTFPLVTVIPAPEAMVHGLALPHGHWKRLEDGAIRVEFSDAETLETCLMATKAVRESDYQSSAQECDAGTA